MPYDDLHSTVVLTGPDHTIGAALQTEPAEHPDAGGVGVASLAWRCRVREVRQRGGVDLLGLRSELVAVLRLVEGPAL